MNTTRPTLPMIPPQTPLRVSGIHGRDIDRKAINELQRIQGELGTGLRKAITVKGGDLDTYPAAADKPNMYKIKWIQMQHEAGEYDSVGDTNVKHDQLSGKDFDAYVFNSASLDPLPLEAYIEEGTILDVHDHNTFCITEYRTDHMRVKAKAEIAAYDNDGCPVTGMAIVMSTDEDCEAPWKDDQESADDYKIGEVEIHNIGGAIEKDEHFSVYKIGHKWYTGDRGGSKAEIIRFEYESTESTPSTIDPSASSSEDEGLCTFVPTVVNFPVARVVAPMCGSAWPEDMDIDGNVELTDPLNILDGRKVDDMIGRQGIAVRMEQVDGGSGSSTSDGCEWVIVYIDFHRWVTVVTDFIVNGDDNTITIKRKNVKVWDECRLPDEVIEGADCGAGSSSSGSSSSGV